MRNLMTTAAAIFLLCGLVGCGVSDTEVPDLPEDFDESALVDPGAAKSDQVTNWFMAVQGDIGFNQGAGGQTSAWEWFHGYTFELKQGDSVVGKAEGSWYGYFALYGPQKASGKWGGAKVRSYIDWNDELGEYTTKLDEFTANKDGRYVLVIGSPWEPDYSYYFSLTCTSGACGTASYCLEYETIDAAGNPLRDFYAVNVGSYEEGKAILDSLSTGFINEDINEGTCADQPNCVTFMYAPVCGTIADSDPTTYGALCNFKYAVRQAAGEAGKAEGHFEIGECEGVYCYHDGKQYKVGESRPADDGCNTCSCMDNGGWACTKIFCGCNPETEWWRDYVLEDEQQCWAAYIVCPEHTTYFSNSCGCGCEQDRSCPEWINCMPPRDCSDLRSKCPYSEIAW